MFLWSQAIYGPVRSRRLGVSLGVNLLPVGKKVCTYDCPYCECGFTRGAVVLAEADTRLPAAEAVLADLRAVLEAQPADEPINTITFAGNGEPTLHPEIERVMAGARELRDGLAPGARIAVLTNGIRLREVGLREAVLGAADDVEVKLDAGSEATFRLVSAPTVPWSLAELRSLLLDLGSRVNLQSCLFAGAIDNTGPADIEGMIEIIGEARPRRVLAYTLDRAPADSRLVPAQAAVLEGFVGRVKGVGVPAQVY